MAEKKTGVTEVTDAQLAALADRLTDPATPISGAGPAKTDAAAAAQGHALMLREYGDQETLDAVLRKAGRPKIDQNPKGASPTVRGRISEADYAAFKQLEAETGRSQSEVVREAVRRLLADHRRAR